VRDVLNAYIIVRINPYIQMYFLFFILRMAIQSKNMKKKQKSLTLSDYIKLQSIRHLRLPHRFYAVIGVTTSAAH